MRGWLVFFSWTLAAALLHAAAQEHSAGMAQDDTGRLWAIQQEPLRGVAKLKGREWQNEPVPQVGDRVAKYLMPLSDGSVACLWGSPENISPKRGGGALTRHRGDRAAVVTPGLPDLSEERILERSDGSLLITESGPTLVLVSTKGEARVMTIPDEFFHHSQKEYSNWRPYQPVCAVEDGAHRIWLWSNAPAAEGKRQLASFVVLEGAKLSRRVLHDMNPDETITDMVRVDAGHLWFARGGTGIYSLDTESGGIQLLSTEVPEGNDGGLAWVEQMFREGDDWFAVIYPEATTVEDLEITSGLASVITSTTHRNFNLGKPCGRLLRYREEKWEVMLAGLDVLPRFGWRERPHLFCAEGLLLGSHESGPWLTLRPGEAPALQHGWDTSFPLPDAVALLPMGEGKMRALASDGQTAIVPTEAVVANPRGLRRFTSAHPALEDSKGNLWCMRDDETLVKWNGADWIEQASPKLKSESETDWWGDDRDQGWYFGDDDKAAICDFTTGAWKHYPGRDAALVAQLPGGTHLSYLGQQYWLPVYSGTGQIAWLNGFNGLHFYDGAAWRVWTAVEIAGKELNLEGAPSFNSAHQLCLPLGDSNFTWDAVARTWQPVPRPAGQQDTAVDTEPPVILPEGCTVPGHTSGATDSLGTVWFTSAAGELFKAAPGRTVPVFSREELNPFRHGRKIRQALLDARGGVMLLVSAWHDKPIDFFYVPAQLPLPATTAKLRAVGGDTARIQMGTEKPATEIWFSWQLDGGAWQAVQQEKELTLTQLKPGKHRLAIRAYNAELGAGRTPAVLDFSIEAGAVETMKANIARLSHPTRERREAAARELRAQGVSALPALKEAQKSGPADGQWWVNKVIEQIEADLAREGK